MKTFEKYVDDLLLSEYGTSSRLADVIGMSLSAFSRGVRVEDTLSIENCLKLALVTGDHPASILRLAHHEEMADILALLCGPEAATPSRNEWQLIHYYREGTPLHRRSILVHAKAAAHEAKSPRE